MGLNLCFIIHFNGKTHENVVQCVVSNWFFGYDRFIGAMNQV